MRHFRYLMPLPLLLAAAPALAQQAGDANVVVADYKAEPITVTATGTARPAGESGQAISIIGASDLRALQTPDLTAALARLPGVSFDRSGGIGAASGLFVRGANSEQVLVLIDGVKVEDTAAPSGGYDFGGLLTGGIGRIELLRGSNSVAWGSDAIGGVLAVTSRELNGAEASLEYGSHQSWDAEASAGIQRAGGGITLSGGYFTTDGIPTLATDSMPNAFGQWHISGRAHLDLAPGLQIVAAGRYADGKLGVDSYNDTSFVLGHWGDWQTQKSGSGRIGLSYAAGPLTLNAGVAESDTRRAYIDPPSGSLAPYETADGRSTRADLSGHLALPAHFGLDFGADHEHTSFGVTYFGAPEGATANLDSGHALLGYHDGRLDVTAGARVDHHNRFGTHWSFGANGALRLAEGVRLKASYGEGFKAPSLYQLYDPSVGTATLAPETSHSYDMGLEAGSRDGVYYLAGTWFSRQTSNLIDYVDCYTLVLAGCTAQPYGYYLNIGRAHAQGVELEGAIRPVPSLQLRAQYSWVKSIDETPGDGTTGNDLARRPRSLLSASADWTSPQNSPMHGASFGGDVRIVGPGWDDAANTAHLAAYALVSLRASVPVAPHVELFGRIENLGAERYQTVRGYNAYGRTATIGVRARL